MNVQPLAPLTEAALEQKISRSKVPMLVVFSAKWCGPCRLMQPIVEELEQEFGERIEFVKVDVEAYPQLSTKFMVLNVPTFVLYQNGKKRDRLKGMQPKQMLAQALEKLASR